MTRYRVGMIAERSAFQSRKVSGSGLALLLSAMLGTPLQLAATAYLGSSAIEESKLLAM